MPSNIIIIIMSKNNVKFLIIIWLLTWAVPDLSVPDRRVPDLKFSLDFNKSCTSSSIMVDGGAEPHPEPNPKP